MEPAMCGHRPRRMRTIDVFPEPFGPVIKRFWPLRTCSVICFASVAPVGVTMDKLWMSNSTGGSPACLYRNGSKYWTTRKIGSVPTAPTKVTSRHEVHTLKSNSLSRYDNRDRYHACSARYAQVGKLLNSI